MKKIISAIAALSVCAVLLTACGGGESAPEDQSGTASISSGNSAESANGNSDENSDSNSGNDGSGEHSVENEAPKNESDNSDSESDNSGNSAELNESDSGGNSGSTDDEYVPSQEEEEIVFEDDDEEENYSEPENNTASSTAFASVNEFAESEISMLPFESVSFKSSNTYDFLNTFDSKKFLHLDIADLSSNSFLTIYLDNKNNRLAITIVRDDIGMVLPIIVAGSKVHMLDPMNMTCVYTDADKSVFTDILSLIGVDKKAVSDSKNISSCKITIGSKEYIFENCAGGGFLYETNGNPYAIVSNADSLDYSIKEIKEFSENVPDGVFDIPEGYVLIEDTGAEFD